MFDLQEIQSRLARRVPVLAAPPQRTASHAAVALTLCRPAGSGTELLFIERARHEGDYWSGDVAFPGGRRESGDATIEATVLREVQEEIGVALPAPAGRLDDYDARWGRRFRPLVVSPFVFVLNERPRTTRNHEVEEVLWVPLARLADPNNAVMRTFTRAAVEVRQPALRLDRHVVWGITLRLLRSFFAALGGELPRPPRESA